MYCLSDDCGLLGQRERHIGQHVVHQAIVDGDGLGILMGKVDEHGLTVEVVAQLHGHAVLGRDVIDRLRKGNHQDAAVVGGRNLFADDAWREKQTVVGMQGVFLHVQPDRQGACPAEHDGGKANLSHCRIVFDL